jgi:tetratricopeptide (TPR) repeat protein
MKRKTTYFFILMLFGGLSLFAQRVDFEKANRLYDEGNYQKALSIYDSLYKAGYENTAIAYNAANAYYRLGNIGMATVYYERALAYSPEDEDVLFNLEIIRQLTIDEIKPLPKPLFVMWFRTLSATLSWSTWMGLSIILIWTSWIYHAYRRWKGKRGVHWVFVAVSTLSVIMLVIAIENYTFNSTLQRAVVLEDTVYLKNEPNESGTDLFLLHEGTVVEVRDNLGDWYKIWLEDGKVGWVSQSALEKI